MGVGEGVGVTITFWQGTGCVDQISQQIVVVEQTMEDDIRRGLLSKKVGFEKMYEDGLIRVAKIRQKNDAFQKHIGPDIDDDLRDQVQEQSRFIEKQIKELRALLSQMENKYRDPESKNKTKTLKADAQKQIQRNKIILKDIIRSSFKRRSFDQKDGVDEGEGYIQGGAIDYGHLNNGHDAPLSNGQDAPPKKESVLTDPEEQLHFQIDYQVERKMMLQKNAMIDEVEQATQRVNQIINDSGRLVEEQGENLDLITDELMTTNKNMTATNQNMEEAVTLQKKSRRKYVCLVAIIILIIIAAAGVIFFLTSSS